MSCATLIKAKKCDGVDWSVFEQIQKMQKERRKKIEKKARPALFRKRSPMR